MIFIMIRVKNINTKINITETKIQSGGFTLPVRAITPIEITISIDTDIISCILSAKIVPRLIDRFDFDSFDNRIPLYKSPTLMKATELANHPIKIIPDNLMVLGIFFPLALSIFASFAINFHLKPLKIKLK